MLSLSLATIPDGEYIFCPSGSSPLWVCISHPELESVTLADFLDNLGVVVDDDAQFVRVKRYYNKSTALFEYRMYSQARVRINIIHIKF